MNTNYAGLYLVLPKPNDDTLKLALPVGAVDADGSKGGFLAKQTEGVRSCQRCRSLARSG
jgi:hypothetical protein